MVTDEVWAAAGAADSLCVGCLEERLGRQLVPEDFPALPLNDDHETDSVRLRTRKGSGRCVERLYGLGVKAVLDLGVDAAVVAARLGLDGPLLGTWVDNAKFNREALAEIEADR
jgi:hypothetical protein